MGYRAHCLPCIGKPVFHLILVTIHPDIHDILSNKKKTVILQVKVFLPSWWHWFQPHGAGGTFVISQEVLAIYKFFLQLPKYLNFMKFALQKFGTIRYHNAHMSSIMIQYRLLYHNTVMCVLQVPKVVYYYYYCYHCPDI